MLSLIKKHSGEFSGNWSDASIREFISRYLEPPYSEITSLVNLLHFQNSEQVNIAIFSDPIAFCPRNEIVRQSGFSSSFVITRPLDGVQIPVQRYTQTSLLKEHPSTVHSHSKMGFVGIT
jgi:hypothetical protein